MSVLITDDLEPLPNLSPRAIHRRVVWTFRKRWLPNKTAAANPAVRFQFFHKVQVGQRPSRRVAELGSLGD